MDRRDGYWVSILAAGARPARIALVLWLFGAMTTCAVVRWEDSWSKRVASERFDATTVEVARQLSERLAAYEHALFATRVSALLAGVPNVTRVGFRRSVAGSNLEKQFPGIHGLGLIRRFPASDELAFVWAARRDGEPSFGVRQITPQSGDRYVIQYIEPQADNQNAVGLDIASEPSRKQAAEEAMRTGRATITAPITLVQATNKPQDGFLLLLPIYLPDAPLSSVEQRDAATNAWAYAALVMDEVLADYHSSRDYTLALTDGEASSAGPFFRSGGFDEPDADRLVSHASLPIHGRTWLLELRSRPGFVAGLNFPSSSAMFGAGFGISALLGALGYLYAQATRRREEVRAEQSRRAAIVESSSDAVIAETLDGRIIDWNSAAERLFGYSVEQALGQATIALTVPEQYSAEALQVRAMVRRGECPKPFDSVRRAADGRLIEVSITISPITASDGTRIGLSKTIRDISDARRAEQAVRAYSLQLEQQVTERTAALATTLQQLQTTTERMTLATDGAKIGVWELDLATQDLTWDAWMYRLYGHEPGDGSVPGAVWTNTVHPEDRAAIAAELAAAQRGERELDTEFRVLWPNGEEHFVRAQAHVIRSADGTPTRLTGVNFDTTARKQAELKTQALSQLLRNVLEAASEVSLIATDPQMVINVFNRGAERLLGYDASELVGKATPSVIHDAAEVEQRARELSARSGEPVEGTQAFIHPLALMVPREWTYVRKDGSRVAVSLVVTQMRSGDGTVFGYLGVAYDVTQQKEYEASLREAMRRAEDANRAKSDFLANISHEIRTPMNAVIGVAHLLGRTELDSEQIALVSKIQLASKSLLGLLNDVLDFSKIEAGELRVERTPFLLHDAISDLHEAFSLQAKGKGIDFEIDVEAGLPLALEGDVVRLNQVVANLLTNAFKFTARGRVSLRVWRASNPDEPMRLGVAVEDTGIGMTAEQLSRVFSPFQQADSSTTRRFGGTGLGLSIVKRLIGLMGGQLEVHSEPDRGSRFAVCLPFATASSDLGDMAKSDRIGEHSLQGVSVLLADDSEVNQFVAGRMLEGAGARVTLANNGEQAVSLIEARPADFQVVLMDLQMPIMDGRTATRWIRERLGLASLPVIALTADARASEREGAIEDGMNGFVSKPFEPIALLRCVLKHARARTPAVNSAVASAPLASTLEAWPELVGIDTALAKTRLGDDLSLFTACINSLIRQYAPLPPLLAEATDAELLEYARSMHRLQGAAGQVAAETVRELAGELESACRAGLRDRIAELQIPLAISLEQLAASHRSLPSRRAHRSADACPPLQAPELARLLDLLKGNELSALEELERLAPGLEALLGPERFTQLQASAQTLSFVDTVRILESAGSVTTAA